MLLAGDIGGTKTILALFDRASGPRAPLAQTAYRSADYACLAEMVRHFLRGQSERVSGACFGLAGPVLAGRGTLTNLDWPALVETELAEALGLPAVKLLNDLEAIAWGVTVLEPADLATLRDAPAAAGGAIAVIAPGTGLGEAYLTWDETGYRAHACEGGHTDFAPTTPQQLELARFLMARFEHVSYERVCSGIGLPNIYAFLKEAGGMAEPAWLAERLAAAADPTPIIVNAGLEGSAAICRAALDLFVETLGAEAGNLALKVLATGGVYLGGGIPPRILPALQGEGFRRAFLGKGRMGRLLAGMPVHVIVHPQPALAGAAAYGLRQGN
jgi:glucokinase